MTYERPIRIWSARAGASYGNWVRWDCRHCPGVYGWAKTVAEAADAGVTHLNACPTALAGLDRLVAAVMAVPDVVSMPAWSDLGAREAALR